jgi:endonuclease/exonuclease/phosphatase family metal-dependent hydrolase
MIKGKTITLVFCALCLSISAQMGKRGDLRLMFYNVENLFDTINDPLKNDDEFTPQSMRNWNYYRYSQKLQNIYKTIANIGEWEAPECIGLCEIENRGVLQDLVYKTPLYKYDYEIVHYDSPDLRGIDLGCLYRKDKLEVLESKAIAVVDPENPDFMTRDILYISFQTVTKDTLHVFLNHWPSRWGGKEQSNKYRILASQTLSRFIRSSSLTMRYLILMGDFNDGPSEASIKNLCGGELNLANLASEQHMGTLKYQGTWDHFDQIMVSYDLLTGNNNWYTSPSHFHIARFDYLLEPDLPHSGQKPFRTFQGYTYQGGFSDHLPIVVDLHLTDRCE